MQKIMSGACKMQVRACKRRASLTSLMSKQSMLFCVRNDRKLLHLVRQNFMAFLEDFGVLVESTSQAYTEQSKSPAGYMCC